MLLLLDTGQRQGGSAPRVAKKRGRTASVDASLEPGTLVLDGRFRVVKTLGQGGMGEVYLAEQVSLGRQVALKVLRRDLSMQPGMGERFEREAKLLSSVDHPSVVRVIDFGQSGQASCLVMELVEGETLQAVLGQGALPPERARTILTQLARGLEAIHARGIVHRDLKPENVVLTRTPEGERARLLDFGIARLADPGENDPKLSQVGLIIGTPEYLSPEQALGRPVDPRTDLYSLGVLGYRMLSGQSPFPGPTAQQFLAQHASQTPPPLDEKAPGLQRAPELVSVVMACLRKDPQARPQTASAIAQALEAKAPAAPSTSPALRLDGRRLREYAPFLAALATLFVLLGAVLVPRLLSTAHAVRGLLADGKAQEALERLSRKEKSGPLDAELLGLKAWTLHRLDRHREELGTFDLIRPAHADEVPEEALAALFADFGDGERTAARETLGRLRTPELLKRARRLAKQDASAAQWGALRYLDLANETAGLDRAERYEASLASSSCHVKGLAARRLGELGAVDAIGALKEIAAAARPLRFGILEGDCGHDAARAAIRQLEKTAKP